MGRVCLVILIFYFNPFFYTKSKLETINVFSCNKSTRRVNSRFQKWSQYSFFLVLLVFFFKLNRSRGVMGNTPWNVETRVRIWVKHYKIVLNVFIPLFILSFKNHDIFDLFYVVFDYISAYKVTVTYPTLLLIDALKHWQFSTVAGA